jgi:primosomal protein N' (replication factor Y)
MREQSAGLHPETVRALAQVRAERGKAIVLLNRRGWSNFLSCHSCGHVWSCPECDVALVLHRHGGYLACHHCGHREPAPERCAQCGSISVARHGAGTERLQHDLAAALYEDERRFPIVRLDADTAGTEDLATLLHRFEAAESGVLIGTQMVAKGHDFPDVTLGIVLDADATLRFPDFRAEERTFALIAQLAGRVGRGAAGRVLVQTIAPDARAIVHAASHDSDGFLAGELDRRRALGYPPFSHLIRIVCSSPEVPPARATADALAARLHQSLADAPSGRPSILGPASLFRLRGQERQMLVIKAQERRPAVRAVGEAVQRVASERPHRGVSFSVDVDPQ